MSYNKTDIQTRSEVDGIRNFDSFQTAYDYAMENAHVWKLSFNLPNGERVRLVKHSSYGYIGWNFEPINVEILKEE